MFNDRPKVQRYEKAQVPITSREVSASKGNHVENCLTDGIEHNVSLWILVLIVVAVLDVSVSPVAEFRQINFHAVQ